MLTAIRRKYCTSSERKNPGRYGAGFPWTKVRLAAGHGRRLVYGWRASATVLKFVLRVLSAGVSPLRGNTLSDPYKKIPRRFGRHSLVIFLFPS